MNSISKPLIYFAAPLFNPSERTLNQEIAMRLTDVASIFLPQRDGQLMTDLIRDGCPVERAQRQVFDVDKRSLDECDLLVAVLDGRTIDEGVAFEIGYVNALNKPCVGLKTDDRMMLPTGDNPMIVCACDCIASTVDELVEEVRAVCAELEHSISRNSIGKQTGISRNS